jgi:hypothetical protein
MDPAEVEKYVKLFEKIMKERYEKDTIAKNHFFIQVSKKIVLKME